MLVETCSSLRPSLRSHLQDAGLVYLADVAALLAPLLEALDELPQPPQPAELNALLSSSPSVADAEGVPTSRIGSSSAMAPAHTTTTTTTTTTREDDHVAAHDAVRRAWEQLQKSSRLASVLDARAWLELVELFWRHHGTSSSPSTSSRRHISGGHGLRPTFTMRTLGELRQANDASSSPQPQHITTFCRQLDTLLGGGFAVGEVCEISGPPGAGKTQLLLQMAVNASLPVELGGLNSHSLFIDTEGSFVPERLEQVAAAAVARVKDVLLLSQPRTSGTQKRPRTAMEEPISSASSPSPSSSSHNSALLPSSSSPASSSDATHALLHSLSDSFTLQHVLERVRYLRVVDLVSFMATLHTLDELVCSTLAAPIQLILIDSVAAPFRVGDAKPCEAPASTSSRANHNQNGSTAPWQRAQLLRRCRQLLTDCASSKKVAIIVSNHMTTTTTVGDPNTSAPTSARPPTPRTVLVPALGDGFSGGLPNRLLLSYHHYCHHAATPSVEGDGAHQQAQSHTTATSRFCRGGAENVIRGHGSLAQQHRVARVIKSASATRDECCFYISAHGVRDYIAPPPPPPSSVV